MPALRDGDVGVAPWLDFVATGGQSLVFGTTGWVVKIPRRSWQTALGRVLVHPRTPVQALEVLGGLLEPFALLGRAVFRGPAVASGRAVAGTSRVWSARWAVAGRRQRADDFLDRRIAAAGPAEAAALIDALFDTLDAIRCRGWHVLDFIMSNFVAGADGRVRLVDAGLLVPVSHLRWPSQHISSRIFARQLVIDYRAVLADVAARHPDDAAGRARLMEVAGRLDSRVEAWRAGPVRGPALAGCPAVSRLDAGLSAQILAALEAPWRKLPLTPRASSGYTAPHHAIPSEN